MISQLYFYNAHSMQKSMLGTFELTKEDKDEALPSIRESTNIYQTPFLCLLDKVEVVCSLRELIV